MNATPMSIRDTVMELRGILAMEYLVNRHRDPLTAGGSQSADGKAAHVQRH